MNEPNESRFVSQSGISLAVRTYGVTKPNILFVHGFGATCTTWHSVQQKLSEAGHSSISIDLKGCGLSDKPKDGRYSMRDQAALVREFVLSRDLRSLCLVGHSMGGGIALLTVLESSEAIRGRFSSLILVDAGALPMPPPFFVRPLRIPLLGELLLAVTTPRSRARFTLSRIVHDQRTVTSTMLDGYCRGASTSGYNRALLHAARSLIPSDSDDLVRRYSEITTPVHLVWGENDSVIPVAFAHKLDSILPNSTLTTVPSCGHIPQEEQPALFAQIIRAELSKR